MPELHDLSAVEQRDLLQRREISALELTEHYLARIERIDPAVGAFVTVTADAARDRARSLDAAGPSGAPLWGLPLGDKDLARRAGVRSTSGSRLFADLVPGASDEIVDAVDAAGAVSLGKTNTPEFGFASYTENLVAPPTRTPWDLSLGAGGSSGGAAAAVAAGLVPFAPASDGGGSIRIPAAATGLVGLKPSRGRVPSGSGLASLAGLVTSGPIARTVADAALLFDALVAPTGHRSPWEFATAAPRPDAAEGRLRIGVTTRSPWEATVDLEVSAEATEALAVAMRELGDEGHDLEEFDPGFDDGYGAAFRTVWMASAANLPADGAQLDLLEPLTQWLVARGRALSARDLGAALQQLTAFERRTIRSFARFDAVLTPTLALTPRPIGWYSPGDAELNFEQQCLYSPWTSFVNVAGLPAITLPVAQTRGGLPMGAQLIGRPGGEDTLFSIGAQLERRLEWQHRHPPIW